MPGQTVFTATWLVRDLPDIGHEQADKLADKLDDKKTLKALRFPIQESN